MPTGKKLGSIKKKTKRKFGVLKGKIKIAKDFDAPLSLHPATSRCGFYKHRGRTRGTETLRVTFSQEAKK